MSCHRFFATRLEDSKVRIVGGRNVKLVLGFDHMFHREI